MGHTRAEVIKRATQEYRLLDKLVSKLTAAQWRLPLGRPETKDPWTVKDALAHITYWKSGVTLSALGKRRPPSESKLEYGPINHLIYMRWRKRPAKEVLAWHRQAQRDLLKSLRAAPTDWFTRRSRSSDWPFDMDGHSAVHRVKDIERALKKSRK